VAKNRRFRAGSGTLPVPSIKVKWRRTVVSALAPPANATATRAAITLRLRRETDAVIEPINPSSAGHFISYMIRVQWSYGAGGGPSSALPAFCDGLF